MSWQPTFVPVDRSGNTAIPGSFSGPWAAAAAEALDEDSAPLRTLSDRDRTLLASALIGGAAFIGLTLIAAILGDVTRRRVAAIVLASGMVAAASYWYDRL